MFALKVFDLSVKTRHHLTSLRDVKVMLEDLLLKDDTFQTFL